MRERARYYKAQWGDAWVIVKIPEGCWYNVRGLIKRFHEADFAEIDERRIVREDKSHD